MYNIMNFDSIRELQDQVLEYTGAQSDNAQNAANYNAVQIANLKEKQANETRIVSLIAKAVIAVVATFCIIAVIKVFRKTN